MLTDDFDPSDGEINWVQREKELFSTIRDQDGDGLMDFMEVKVFTFKNSIKFFFLYQKFSGHFLKFLILEVTLGQIFTITELRVIIIQNDRLTPKFFTFLFKAL